jgi:hypothetical protein
VQLIDVAVVLVVAYFLVTGLTFLIRPEAVALYDMAPVGAAGRTEVRCYYGALALGLGVFVGYLGVEDLGRQAIVGVLCIAAAILLARVVGAVVDRSWSERYTRTAIPVEICFVAALAVVLAIS